MQLFRGGVLLLSAFGTAEVAPAAAHQSAECTKASRGLGLHRSNGWVGIAESTAESIWVPVRVGWHRMNQAGQQIKQASKAVVGSPAGGNHQTTNPVPPGVRPAHLPPLPLPAVAAAEASAVVATLTGTVVGVPHWAAAAELSSQAGASVGQTQWKSCGRGTGGGGRGFMAEVGRRRTASRRGG